MIAFSTVARVSIDHIEEAAAIRQNTVSAPTPSPAILRNRELTITDAT
jgi:hypothetical protein